MSIRRYLTSAIITALASLPMASFGDADALVKRLLTPPEIKPADGFSARLLVAPGKLYDPLIMLPVGDTTWINDDGGEEKDKGSRLLAISHSGEISVLADVGKLLPTVGFDLAPASFGDYGGDVFTLAQPKVAVAGGLENHVVQRLEPDNDFAASIYCTLPETGPKKISGFGLDARFGPEGSPFAGRLFVVTILNDAIYQVTADGKCEPFLVFDGETYSGPTVMNFTPDGQRMLVSVSRGVFSLESTGPQAGAIVTVSADGKIDAEPLYAGASKPTGMAYAPADFGPYGGQLFFADIGRFQIPVPMTQKLDTDGRVFRIDADGKPAVVATDLVNPIGVQFVNGKLWVADINGDFIAGRRELPDGFIVEFDIAR
jgi:hypothetical protein